MRRYRPPPGQQRMLPHGARASRVPASAGVGTHLLREDRAVSKERRLGRGLEALLGRAWDETEGATKPEPTASHIPADSSSLSNDERVTRDEHGQAWLDCDAIERNPYQPRQTF